VKSDADRRKAAKLRKKKGPLTVEQRAWLSAYDGTKKSKRGGGGGASTAAPKPTPAVRGPQLEWGRPAAAPVAVHETVAPGAAVDPATSTWLPTVPEAPADAPPPPPGTPTPETAGTPLVDAAPTAQPQQGDPHAAKQFAGIVMFVTQIGVANVLDLAQGFAVPPPIAAMVTNENIAAYIKFVGESAERLAIKYNFRGVPLADEAIVGGTIALSVLAFRANTIRKAKLAEAKPAAPETPSTPTPPKVDMNAGGDLNELWVK